MELRRDAFQAIADPTRRDILGLLVKESLNLNSLADQFPVSRPAISKHIRILEECGLVIIQQQGRERYCYADPRKLKEVWDWLDDYRSFWTRKLNALDHFLEQENTRTGSRQSSSKHKKKRS